MTPLGGAGPNTEDAINGGGGGGGGDNDIDLVCQRDPYSKRALPDGSVSGEQKIGSGKMVDALSQIEELTRPGELIW